MAVANLVVIGPIPDKVQGTRPSCHVGGVVLLYSAICPDRFYFSLPVGREFLNSCARNLQTQLDFMFQDVAQGENRASNRPAPAN